MSGLAARAACVLGLLAVFAAGPARAHIVVGAKSLQLHVAEAESVVLARVVDPAARYRHPTRGVEREMIVVEVLEVLKGPRPLARLRIAQHGHGVASYARDDRALFFLRPIEQSRELRGLAGPGGPSYVSSQEHDEAFVVEPPHGEILLSAVRGYAESETVALAGEESTEHGEAEPDKADPEAFGRARRIALIRRATLDLLTSGSDRLGASAVASLVAAPRAAMIRAEDLPRLEPILVDPQRSAGFRAALLAELERRGLVDGPARWRALLDSTPKDGLPAAIRAVAAHPSPEVEAALVRLLGHEEERIAAEAAIALGRPGRVAAVPLLAEALSTGDARLRRGAIRGLGGIGGAEARAALEHAGRTHPDPETRRRACAAARRIGEP